MLSCYFLLTVLRCAGYERAASGLGEREKKSLFLFVHFEAEGARERSWGFPRRREALRSLSLLFFFPQTVLRENVIRSKMLERELLGT